MRVFIELLLTGFLFFLAAKYGWPYTVIFALGYLLAFAFKLTYLSRRTQVSIRFLVFLGIFLVFVMTGSAIIGRFLFSANGQAWIEADRIRTLLLETPTLKVLWAAVAGFGFYALVAVLILIPYGLVAAEQMYSQYEQYKGHEGDAAKTAIAALMGISQGTWIVSNGQAEIKGNAGGALARFGGPGVLIVQEGHAVILEISGKLSRIVGRGITWLRPFERISMVVPLTSRAERITVEQVATRDKVLIEEFAVIVFHKIDPGPEAEQIQDGQFVYNEQKVLGAWSPYGGDWRGAVRSITDGAVRDVVGRFDLGELMPMSDLFRDYFREALRQVINKTTSGALGVLTISVDIGPMKVPDEARKQLMEKRQFKPIENPYITGTPVSAPQMFWGREDIIKFVLDNISGTFQDRPILLHGQRRTGKTSVLYQLRDRRLPKDYIPVYIDMQELAPGIKNDGDLLAEIAYRIGRAARARGIEVSEPGAVAFQDRPTQVFNRFLDGLEGSLAGKRVVLMIDEFAEVIEAKVTGGDLQPELFGYIRSLMQHRRGLVFIFVGAHRLQELSEGYWSVFFNITLQQRISYLSENETRQLITEPVAGALTFDDGAVDKMVRVTHGHPYHVQLLCWVLVNHCNDHRRNYATIHDVNQALEDILEVGEAHFAFVWQEASPRERVLLAVLARMLGPGQEFASLSEIEEALKAARIDWARAALTQDLNELCKRDVLERQRGENLRYGFQLELVRMWIERCKSLEEAVAGVEPT